MKTPQQLAEESREVSGGRLLLAAVVFTFLLLAGAAVSRADVLLCQ